MCLGDCYTQKAKESSARLLPSVARDPSSRRLEPQPHTIFQSFPFTSVGQMVTGKAYQSLQHTQTHTHCYRKLYLHVCAEHFDLIRASRGCNPQRAPQMQSRRYRLSRPDVPLRRDRIREFFILYLLQININEITSLRARSYTHIPSRVKRLPLRVLMVEIVLG